MAAMTPTPAPEVRRSRTARHESARFMYQCLKAGLMALCVAAAASACDWGNGEDGEGAVSGGQAPSTTQNPTIESSLEALSVLPPRIRWSATTSLPPEQVEVVQFFIDGSRWWDDSAPPYTYGPAGAYLPARWLATRLKRPQFRLSRTHDFMVRVKATDGEKWESAVAHVRTPKATFPRPPGGFGGQWGSRAYVKLSRSDLANPPPPGSYPFHGGYLVFIANSIFVRGGVHEGAWEIGGDHKRVRLGTPIFFRKRAYAAPGSGFDGIEGVVCGPDGPPATYAWSQTRGRLLSVYEGVSRYARNLELRAVNDPCAERQRLLEGVWERTGPD
jgi:hypothetical protein